MSAANDHVESLLDDYLHQLLDPQEAVRVAQHCDDCRTCRAARDAALHRLATLRALPAPPLPETLVQGVVQAVQAIERRRRQRRRRVLTVVGGGLAAAAVLLGCLQWYYQSLAPTPYDLVVLGQKNLLAATPAALRVRLIDRTTGVALKGIPVTIELLGDSAGRVQLASFETDAEGTGRPRFQLPEWRDGDYRLRVTAATPGSPEVYEESVRLRRSWKVMLSSDKPVYQPGQTIHFRALTLRQPDLHPVAGQAATFTVTDPKGNTIFKHRPPTSKYGIASGDCELASEIPEGAYVVACTVGDTSSRLAVEVKRYVLPKFKLDVRADKPYYAPGETARLTVQADYYFGKPVAGATVEVATETPGASQGKALQKLRTDAKGNASATFALPAGVDGDLRVTFHVTAVDTAGQTQSHDLTRLVTSRPLRIEVLPECGTLIQNLPNRVYLLTTYADGSPARTKVTVGGIPGALETDEQGMASFEFMPPEPSGVWTLDATDGQGAIDRRGERYDCVPTPLNFIVRTDRAVYDGGSTLRLTAFGRGNEPLFVDVLKDGQTVLTEVVPMKGERGELALDLPPECFGTLRLSAYRLTADGAIRRQSRVVYVRPAEQLTVRAAFDKGEYRPGGRARLDLRLTDSRGNPAAGAVSLAAVDEAVFGVLEQAPGTERSFYTLDRELLGPVYQRRPWQPEARAPQKRERLEQAIFAATSLADWNGTPQARTESRGMAAAGARPATLPRPESTYIIKAQTVDQRRKDALGSISGAWTLLIAAVVVFGGVTLTRNPRQTFGAVCLALCILGCGARERIGFEPSVDAVVVAEEAKNEEAVPLRVRELFPETLLWRPELVTDDDGRASLDIDLADSITTWRLTASAVSADGRLGTTQTPLKVFQPFFVDVNLPVALTRGDEVSVPVVVSSYLDKPQTVRLALDDAPWCERIGGAEQVVELAPGEVKSVSYRVRAKVAGSHTLQVSARGDAVADAVKRSVEVVPDGKRIEQVVNGALAAPARLDLAVPADTVPGSVRAVLKLYPSKFSQLVEGLDGIFQMPHGCFEQTSSTTYPNILALDYLRRTRQSRPQTEAKAQHYLRLGYQRLLSFEVAGGGFDWFGRAPANRTLTAYGLMEFEDMARVHDVDSRLIDRTRRWLLNQRQQDGSWLPDGHTPDVFVGGGAVGGGFRGAPDARPALATTAYVARAVFGNGHNEGRELTRKYLLAQNPATIDDPYTLALVADALLAMDVQGPAAPYLERLDAMKLVSADGRQVWWEQGPGWHTTFYGGGQGGSVETTALATLAFLHARSHEAPTRAALAWLVARRGPWGTWPSTQATVLSLQALLAGADADAAGHERRIEVRLGANFRHEVVIPADQAEVMQQIDLTPHLGRGADRLSLAQTAGTAAGYQVALRYNVPGPAAGPADTPLTISVAYDRTELAVGESVTATATAVLRGSKAPAAMVMLELPVPAGFAASAEDFAELVNVGKVAKFQVRPRDVLVYLRDLAPDQPLSLNYRLAAKTAAKVTAAAPRVYEYYDPDRQGRGVEVSFTVR
jgi:hypothetical protein